MEEYLVSIIQNHPQQTVVHKITRTHSFKFALSAYHQFSKAEDCSAYLRKEFVDIEKSSFKVQLLKMSDLSTVTAVIHENDFRDLSLSPAGTV